MRAVVVLPEPVGAALPVTDRNAGPMLWLGDRPVVQHVCEALVGAGVSAVDWVHRRPGGASRAFLGRGERWGVRFQHYDVAPGDRVYEAAGLLMADGDRPVVFGHADRVIDLSAARSAPTAADTVLFGERDADSGWTWNGWAVFSGPAANHFPRQATTRDELDRLLTARPAAWAEAPGGAAPRCVGTYLAAVRHLLDAAGGEPRVPRSARVHPRARLVGPVWLGPDAEIGAGAVVGPYVAVGPNCVIDGGAAIANAAVLPDTYVGRGVRLDGGFVDRHRVVRLGADGRPRYDTGAPAASLADHPFAGLNPALARAARRLAAAPIRLARRLVGASDRVARPATEPAPC